MVKLWRRLGGFSACLTTNGFLRRRFSCGYRIPGSAFVGLVDIEFAESDGQLPPGLACGDRENHFPNGWQQNVVGRSRDKLLLFTVVFVVNGNFGHTPHIDGIGVFGVGFFVEDNPLVSSDFIGNPFSSILDSEYTKADGKLVKVLAWYDNEWAYSLRMVELAKIIG